MPFIFFLGRALLPADFAIMQTVNAVLLVVITTASVLQPVIARFVVSHAKVGAGLFRRYFWQSVWLSLLLLVVALLLANWAGAWLNVPALAVTIAAFMFVPAFLRPVVAGMLQGQQKFWQFGLSRTAFAVARLLLVVVFVGWLGRGLFAGIVALPLGSFIGLGVALYFLGDQAWQASPAPPNDLVKAGWRLSFAAFVAYALFTSFTSLDLIVVNRLFSPENAGNYATLVVFRRVFAVLPGAALVILYPKVVGLATAGKKPDTIILQTALLIILADFALAIGLFLFGEEVLTYTVGSNYLTIAPLLGWMGIGMIGFGITSLWMNVFLATKPWAFLVGLATLMLVFYVLINQATTLTTMTLYFGVTGWLGAMGGFGLYLVWLRPQIGKSPSNNTSG